MAVLYLVLVVSAALFFFYLQIICQRVLRRKFDQEYFQAIVKANRLAFSQIRRGLEELGQPVRYSQFSSALRCDYFMLSYLLRNAANLKQSYSLEERLLMIYCRILFVSWFFRHWLKLGDKATILRLTRVLEYFANVVGERVNQLRFGNLRPPEYLRTLD